MFSFFKGKNKKVFLYLLAILATLMSTPAPSIADYVNGYTRNLPAMEGGLLTPPALTGTRPLMGVKSGQLTYLGARQKVATLV